MGLKRSCYRLLCLYNFPGKKLTETVLLSWFCLSVDDRRSYLRDLTLASSSTSKYASPSRDVVEETGSTTKIFGDNRGYKVHLQALGAPNDRGDILLSPCPKARACNWQGQFAAPPNHAVVVFVKPFPRLIVSVDVSFFSPMRVRIHTIIEM